MNGFTFSPALGWVAGGLLAAGLAVLAILEIVLFVRRRASSDETAWACIRRTLMLLIVAVMVLTPSVVSSTTSQAINATDVIVAVENTVADIPDMKLNSFVTVADAGKVKVYMKNFGEFYNNQIEAAGTIILSRTQKLTQEKLEAAVALLREKNPTAAILTTPWDQLDGKTILAAVEKVSLADELLEKMRAEHEAEEAEHHHHHHHHHEHDDDDGHDEHEHHHHHHHADDVFASWGSETPRKFTEEELRNILSALDDGEKYGMILRAKGMVDASDGQWLYFDYVPGEADIRRGEPIVTGRFCVIGSKINESALKELFSIE